MAKLFKNSSSGKKLLGHEKLLEQEKYIKNQIYFNTQRCKELKAMWFGAKMVENILTKSKQLRYTWKEQEAKQEYSILRAKSNLLMRRLR